MTFHQLVILRTVIEEGSFIRAAEILRVSQPAISNQIKALEKELGHTLVRRRPGSAQVEPTEAGRVAYQAALTVLKGVEECLDRLAELDQGSHLRSRTVHLVSDVPTGIYVLPRLIAEYRLSHPDTNVIVTTNNFADLPAILRRDTFDVAVVPNQIGTFEALIHFTFYQDLAMVANPHLPPPSALTDWNTIPFVLPSRKTVVRTAVEPYFKAVGIKPKVVLELNHPEAVRKIVRDNLVVAVTHRVSVEEDLNNGVLAELRPPQPLPPLTYKVVCYESRSCELVRNLILFLRERVTTVGALYS